MEIKIYKEKFDKTELLKLAEDGFKDMVKGVVDLETKVVALGGELHADEEALLLQNGSKQENLWGFNLYPNASEDEFIEFDSMINLRPTQNNLSRSVQDPKLQEQIRNIIYALYSH